MDSSLRIDCTAVRSALVDFLRTETARIGLGRVVLGLSGGIDSALVAFLSAEALGPSNVRTCILPYRASNPVSRTHALLVAAMLGLDVEEVDITPMVQPLIEQDPAITAVRRGNILARERMIVLYDRSARDGAIVVGTGNKTEILLGYSTQHGDAACAINPLGDLYKTQVRQLAAHMGVPEEIIQKAPSADLWEGQTDEGELGFTYAEADVILHLLVDQGLGADEIAARGVDPRIVERIQERIVRNEFKRQLPTVARIG